jgi:MoaA/NifB/PqqE/SkfB family radical SAM enzyme
MMIEKIANKISFKENKRRYLNLKGIATKQYAYKGPDVIQIDLTDRCNSRCLLCWLHAPSKENKNRDELDYSAVANFIADAVRWGVREIIFSGGGEPFIYPKIWEILELTQSKAIRFRINTNFTLLNKEDIARLLSFSNLVSLTVSMWAADAALYSKIHNRGIDVFPGVKSNLEFLNKAKSAKLDVRICSVINNVNYRELTNLVALADETGCNAIEFTVPDVIPGVTDSFLLDREQLRFLKQEVGRISKGLKEMNPRFTIANKNIFIKRISDPRACFGEYDSSIDSVPCYAGWTFLRLRANGDFNSCLKSHRIPIGNIYKESPLTVWNNSLQQEFRQKSARASRETAYFSNLGNSDNTDIGCRRVCDNILVNEHFHWITKYFFWIRN